MIVERGFPNHPKTLRLIRSLKDSAAPLMLIRLWGFCEEQRADVLKIDGEDLAAICHYPGAGETLLQALKDARWISGEPGNITVLGWRERNKGLLANIENGGKGGRPRKKPKEARDSDGKPTDNPIGTQEEPKDKPLETHGKPTGNPWVSECKPIEKPQETSERRGDKSREIPPTVPQGGPAGEGVKCGSLPSPDASPSNPNFDSEKKEKGAVEPNPGGGALPVDVRGRWFLERVCSLWGRDPRRALGYEAQSAFPHVLAIERATLEQELLHVEWFYRLPADEAVNELRTRRTSVEKLIANWAEEVDRARGYAKKTGAAILAQKKEGRREPEGWQAAARSLSDQPELCVVPERFAELPSDVQRDVLAILARGKPA